MRSVSMTNVEHLQVAAMRRYFGIPLVIGVAIAVAWSVLLADFKPPSACDFRDATGAKRDKLGAWIAKSHELDGRTVEEIERLLGTPDEWWHAMGWEVGAGNATMLVSLDRAERITRVDFSALDGGLPGSSPFDPSPWESLPTERLAMAVDLAKSGRLLGMTRTEAVALLGQPAMIRGPCAVYEGRRENGQISYGPTLRVTFDAGRVCEVGWGGS